MIHSQSQTSSPKRLSRDASSGPSRLQLHPFTTGFTTGPLMGQYCFARWRLSSVIVVCNAAGGRAGLPPGAWAVGRPTLHGGPVRLRPVRATPCWIGWTLWPRRLQHCSTARALRCFTYCIHCLCIYHLSASLDVSSFIKSTNKICFRQKYLWNARWIYLSLKL